MLMTGNCLSNRILQLLDEVWKTTGHVSVINKEMVENDALNHVVPW